MNAKEIFDTLRESNDLLTSCYQIAKRNGADTNWGAIRKKLLSALEKQSQLLLRDTKIVPNQRIRRPSGLKCGCCGKPILKHESIYGGCCDDSECGDF
jgi:hypothetical protein